MARDPSSLASLKQDLEADVAHSKVAETQKLVLKFGSPYDGIVRPRGFRLGLRKQCFVNAAEAITSIDEKWSQRITYVEGYAMCPNQPPVHHAWLALDGKDAIELTIRSDPRDITYFGVEFSRADLWKMIEQDGIFGVFIYPPRVGLREFLKHRTLWTCCTTGPHIEETKDATAA